jgi:nitrate/nitrite transporter NarK
MLACSMALGGGLAPKITGELLGPFDWRQILMMYAVPGLIWAAAFALLIPRPDAPVVRPPGAAPVRWSKLATDRQMQLLCGQQFLRASAIAFFYTWFPRYLQETKGLSPQESGALAAWPPFAGMVGGLVGGVVSDWLLRRTGNARLSRQGLAVVAMVVVTALALAAYFVDDAVVAVGLISAGVFFGLMGGVSGYTVAIAFGGKRVATVFATMNMCGNIGAGLFPFAVGHLVAVTGNWDQTLLLFAGLFAVDAVLWALLNPKRPLFEDGDEGR